MLFLNDVQIDFTSMEATRGGKLIAMTAQEFKLLHYLARWPEKVISREELLNEVWGYHNYPSTRTVDNHILRLRQKLEPDPANPRSSSPCMARDTSSCRPTPPPGRAISHLNHVPPALKNATADLHAHDHLRPYRRDAPDRAPSVRRRSMIRCAKASRPPCAPSRAWKISPGPLSRTTAMLAELPTLKALMTTHHAPTIRDGSLPFWQLSGSDLFVLADPKDEMMALHSKKSLDSADVGQDLTESRGGDEDAAWWYPDDQLYWVFMRPITAGSGADLRRVGVLAIGYQVDSTVRKSCAGGRRQDSVGRQRQSHRLHAIGPRRERTAAASRSIPRAFGFGHPRSRSGFRALRGRGVSLHADPHMPVQCFVLIPLRRPYDFIGKLDRTILALGIQFSFSPRWCSASWPDDSQAYG